MKTKHPLIALAGSLLLAGCDQPAPPADKPATAPEAKQEMKEAVDAAKSYAADTKDQFTAAMEKKLQELDESIAGLTAKMEALKDDPAAKAALDNLREKRAKLGQKLDEVKQAGREAWQDVKAGFESAMNDLQKACDDAKTKYGGS